MEISVIFQKLAVALGLGLLVGFQRERSESKLGGFRTYPLVTLLGSLCGFLTFEFSGWIIGAGFISLAGLLFMGKYTLARHSETDPGMTSEVAMLVMFALGAFITVGPLPVAVALGGGVAVLLHFKPQMHHLVRTLGDKDVKAAMQFALLALVILPVLPHSYYGPYQVWNPFKIWLMVVIIVGISFGGYVIYKIFGDKVGSLAGGFIGGLISSTATTVSYSRRSRLTQMSSLLPALAILIASGIAYVRVMMLMAINYPPFFAKAWIPFTIVAMTIAVLATWQTVKAWGHGDAETMPEHENPSELKPAFIFALLYALVLLAVAIAREYFGAKGLYVVAMLSGLTDLDAITLSVTQMVQKEEVGASLGWKLVMVASLSNIIFKAAAVWFLGSRQLFLRVAAYFALVLISGIACLIIFG